MEEEQKYKIMALIDHEQPETFYGNDHNYGHIMVRPVKWLTPSGQVRNFTGSPCILNLSPRFTWRTFSYLANIMLKPAPFRSCMATGLNINLTT